MALRWNCSRWSYAEPVCPLQNKTPDVAQGAAACKTFFLSFKRQMAYNPNCRGLRHRSLNVTGLNNRITTKSVVMLALHGDSGAQCCVSEWLQSFVTSISGWKHWSTDLILKFHCTSSQTVARIVRADWDVALGSVGPH